MSETKRVYRHTEEENKKLAEISKQLLGRVNFNTTIAMLIRGFELESCNHPIEMRASFESHGKPFCWKCGQHI